MPDPLRPGQGNLKDARFRQRDRFQHIGAGLAGGVAAGGDLRQRLQEET
jgi:hypothetical protein